MPRKEQIGGATLYLGDCREVLPTLSGVDACVTDPPYGVGLKYESHDDTVLVDWLPLARTIAPVVAFSPGVANFVSFPPDMTERREFRIFVIELSLMLVAGGFALAAAGTALRMAGWV